MPVSDAKQQVKPAKPKPLPEQWRVDIVMMKAQSTVESVTRAPYIGGTKNFNTQKEAQDYVTSYNASIEGEGRDYLRNDYYMAMPPVRIS